METQETKDLIYLLSCAGTGAAPDPARVAAMDLDALYPLASRHMLAATVAPALKSAGIQDPRFAAALKHSVLKNAVMDAEMDALFAELDAAGIWHMPLKGTVLQHLYPVYGMRQMSDHDILFDVSRAEEVRAILEGQGFCTKKFGNRNHDVYYKEPVCNFEMHRALFGPMHEKKLCAYYRDAEKRLLGEGYEKHLSPEDFYVYMTAHEYKHFSDGGTGLRSLLDVFIYLQKQQLDMDYVRAEVEKLGIAEFEAANRSLAQHLFTGEALTEGDREMLAYILSSGVYGTMGNRVENRMSRFGGGKLRYALVRFFVPFSKKNKYYDAYVYLFPVFYKHKILLPFLPFYRLFHAMKSGKLQAEVKALRH